MLRALVYRLASVTTAWTQRAGQKLANKAASLPEDKVFDLTFLHQEGFVRARASGQSITTIYGEVENRLSRRWRVSVLPGTCFIARGRHQNMVTRRAYRFTLSPHETRRIVIDAACLNAGRSIPEDRDRFDGVRSAPAELRRFLDAAQDADPMVVQAGVWALTDGYSERDVQHRLSSQDRYGRPRPAVSDAQIAEARRILRRLGIHSRL